jgi:alpha-ketoglutarate-dependent taurine dioxygenase
MPEHLSLASLEDRMQAAFGSNITVEGPLSASGAGVRLHGLDLVDRLAPNQVTTLLDALAWYRIVTLPGQDLERLSLDRFERFANYWGAPVPHPSNFMRGGKPGQSDGATEGAIEMRPRSQRMSARVDAAFEGLDCMAHDSPAVLVVANFSGNPAKPGELPSGPLTTVRGGTWHTDIEYEPLPIYVSMFLVHKAPGLRDANGHWVADPNTGDNDAKPYFEGSSNELMDRRKRLPLDGETAFVDTAAAFTALGSEAQAHCRKLRLRRRLNEGDAGWLAPIVRRNPRSGVESLHSPIWASRPGVRPPVFVDGETEEASRRILDDLEAHVLNPEFRYDHVHNPGDVTIWDNYMTLHNSPPMKVNIRSSEDARLMYRLSCKGEPALTLPRQDAPAWLRSHISAGYRTPGS